MMKLGDTVENVLSSVGITEERIKAITGKDCGCKKRKAALNLYGFHAQRRNAAIKEAIRSKIRAVRSYRPPYRFRSAWRHVKKAVAALLGAKE